MSTSVVRAARILDRLAHSRTPMTLAEIASELDIPKSTAYTILRDLASESFVTVSSPPAYSIGLKAFEVGSAHLRASGTAGAVAPELARLTRALNITSHYAVLDGTEVLYLCKEDPPTLGIQLASAPPHVRNGSGWSAGWRRQTGFPAPSNATALRGCDARPPMPNRSPSHRRAGSGPSPASTFRIPDLRTTAWASRFHTSMRTSSVPPGSLRVADLPCGQAPNVLYNIAPPLDQRLGLRSRRRRRNRVARRR